MDNKVTVRGHVRAYLFGPDGVLKGTWEQHNLVTDIGDQCIAKQLYSSAAKPAGMKLGTATTPAAKNSTGSFIPAADYVAGSALALDSTFPKAGSGANVAQYQVTYGAGVATATLGRVALVDNTTNAGEADATHTIAIAVFTAPIPKGSGDSLVVTWNITVLGA